MAKYDDASWHYGGDYPKDLPNEESFLELSVTKSLFKTICQNLDKPLQMITMLMISQSL